MAGTAASASGSVAPISVVVLRNVPVGREAVFAEWQGRIDAAAATFAGFSGSQVVPPDPPHQTDWAMITRFRTREGLLRWLSSDIRYELIKQGRTLEIGEPTVYLTAPKASETKGSAHVISHHVRPGREQAYRDWQAKAVAVESTFPGYLGMEEFKPDEGSDDTWTTIIWFETQADLDRWMDSAERQALLEETASIVDVVTTRRISSGFDAWFRFATGPTGGVGIPTWKQTAVVLLALYPTVLVITQGMQDLVELHVTESVLLGNIIICSLLGWVLMPLTTRLMRWWLHPKERAGWRVDLAGLLVIAVALTGMLFLFKAIYPTPASIALSDLIPTGVSYG